MSKNAKNIFYTTLAMSNDINLGEGWEGGNKNTYITLDLFMITDSHIILYLTERDRQLIIIVS
jgi:hypothetical protein